MHVQATFFVYNEEFSVFTAPIPFENHASKRMQVNDDQTLNEENQCIEAICSIIKLNCSQIKLLIIPLLYGFYS